MKKGRMISAALILMLSTVIFGMSGDGGNVPVVPKKEAVNVTAKDNVPVEQKENVVQSTTYETVKDEFGIDTGKTKDELKKFEEDYANLKSKILPMSRSTMLFDYRIDLNKYDEFKKLGVDLKNSGAPNEATIYKENALYSDIILVGKTLEEDTIFGYDMFKIEIYEVIKGADIFKEKLNEIPETFHYIGEKDVVGQTDPVIGIKGIYFFSFAKRINKDRTWVQKRPESTILLLDDNKAIYEKGYQAHLDAIWYRNAIEQNKDLSESKKKAFERWAKANDNKGKIKESFEDVINNIKKIIEVNDSQNFYKKNFKSEVQK